MNFRTTPFLLLAAAAVAGCTNTVLVPIAGDERALVTFGSHGPVMVSEGGIRIVRAGMEVNAAAKAVNYVFDFTVSDGRPPRNVTVEDVTDSDAVMMAEDDRPSLADKHWHFVSPSMTSTDSSLGWLLNIEQTMRIYRFTVVTADGRKVVLYQAEPYSQPLKSAIRKSMGMDY